MTYNDKARIFRQLHHGPRILALPNAWDVVSAKIFASVGFPAIATTSAGVANCLGFRDGERIPFEELIFMTRKIVNAVDIPVTADIESGYSQGLEQLAQSIAGVVDSGAIGINIEDATPAGELIDPDFNALKIQKVRTAASSLGAELFINARIDVYLLDAGRPEDRFAETTNRATAYKAAGADCIFVPGVVDQETIQKLVSAIEGPINVLAVKGTPSLEQLENFGVARVSTGSGPARACATFARDIAVELRDHGSYGRYTENAISYNELNGFFEP